MNLKFQISLQTFNPAVQSPVSKNIFSKAIINDIIRPLICIKFYEFQTYTKKFSYFVNLIFLARKSSDLCFSVTVVLLDVKVAASTTKPIYVTSSISSRGRCKMAGFSARRHFEKSANFS